ncbi:DegT/DnrJ/EryC1/StrS aminotransferase family protein [Telmatospirillum sp. J64-1]|uniref:DegT/DnrJ/EryC1/StrS family aminotransferase n=1 Tax=Telmatospirillum sp. J64-1 TaxID=2502183 RepID=UPI00115CB13D|nr:DegT/DnrJ/EryC1/StrS aminotransferase family protein [Telmatospirillum sp. J64-1]
MSIPFIDLPAQRRRLGARIDQAIARVLDHGAYILGPEVTKLEEQLAAFAETRFAVTCANGTDALQLVLMAEGIGPGDAVFVPAFTFVATGEVVPLVGATPVFVDVLPDTFNMDPASLEAAIGEAERQGLKPRMVIPVDLFGQPADYPAIQKVADRHGLTVLADSAQGFGGRLNGKSAASLAKYTSTSFFPAKPLGCYGDGGAIFTDDEAVVELLKSIRMHGQGRDRYENVRIGLNSRLDTIQAAILLEKLDIFPDEIEARDRIAQRYNDLLKDVAEVPVVMEGARSVWAQYTILVDDRAKVAEACKANGVPTAIYYPIPLNQQGGYNMFPVAPGGVKVAESLSRRVISLPMHPYLDEATQDRIVAVVRGAL